MPDPLDFAGIVEDIRSDISELKDRLPDQKETVTVIADKIETVRRLLEENRIALDGIRRAAGD
jgi:archaellum component FlaC